MVTIPVSINLHITNKCNYKCKFCFAKHENKHELNFYQWERIIDDLINNGCKKINIAGGEPTLIPFLPNLIDYIHSKGIFTSIISNGTGLNSNLLNKCKNCLDLIGLSIDSAKESVEQQLGRCCNNNHVQLIKSKAKIIHQLEIPLKINTVICSLNWMENMHDLISEIKPIRWKVLQCYKIEGINESFFDTIGFVTPSQFEYFVENHKNLHPIIESNDIMENSYCMITPDGRFYQNSGNQYQYSEPILKKSAKKAFSQLKFDLSKFKSRSGLYY